MLFKMLVVHVPDLPPEIDSMKQRIQLHTLIRYFALSMQVQVQKTWILKFLLPPEFTPINAKYLVLQLTKYRMVL